MKSCVTALLLLSACGAKTGLEIPDSSATMDAAPRDARPLTDARCPDVPVPLARTDVETVFVLDGSGSMGTTWDGLPFGSGLPSRWMIVHDTLGSVLPPFDAQLAFGAKIFPHGALCDVNDGLDVMPHVSALSEVLALFGMWIPDGGTPTALALRRVLDVPSNGPRVIVLTTDGGPNCNMDTGVPPDTCVCTGPRRICLAPPPDGPEQCLDSMATLDVLHEAHDMRGVPVVVVGIDDPTRPDLSDFLDQMAIAGGWPRPLGGTRRFYDAQMPGDLTTAFTEITNLIAQCVYVASVVPPDRATMVVRVNGVPVAQDPTHAMGWDWTDRAAGALAFFGPSCDPLRTGTATVTADIVCGD